MDGQLILSYPWYFLAFCILLGFGIAGWMYFRDRLLNEHSFLKYLLFGLRAALISALAFLLLGPVWKGVITKTEKPIVIYLEDISQSVSNFTPEAELEVYRNNQRQLYEDLSENFEVEQYRFGANLISWEDSVTGTEKASNISGAINELLEIHSYQNVGALIMASDGIYNQGFNPAYSNLSSSTSIYTIALGDSTPSRDLFIQALQYPKVVYLGDQFQLDVEWGAYNLAGSTMTILVKDGAGSELLRKTIPVGSDEVFARESIIADATVPGIQKLNISLITSEDEDVNANNYQSAYIEVMDGRKNVLLLYDGPHPDVKALKSVIEQNKNYEVKAESASKFSEQNDRIDAYDLVIFHGLPSTGGGPGANLLKASIEKGKSVIIIIAANSDLAAVNTGQSILDIKPSGSQVNDVQALFNRNFNEFQIPQGLIESFRSYPPLIAPFAEYDTGPNTNTIVWQRLDDINTGYPLIVSGQEEASRIMVIAGEGIWRWRMMEYARKDNTEVFDAFINQLIQYVSVKEDKRKFRLFVNKNLIWENEAVRFSAELYNANYELVNESDVNLTIRGDDGNSYQFAMDKTLNAYTLDAGLMPVGSYTATATSLWSGESYNSSVKFTVREVQLETLNKQANHKMLFNLSVSTGGAAYQPGSMLNIVNDVEQNVNLKPVLYNSEKTTSLLHFQWIFFILLGLLTIEWFVRKWLGGF